MVTAADLQTALQVTNPTANAVLRDLGNLGLVSEVTGRQWGRAYAFQRYIALFAM